MALTEKYPEKLGDITTEDISSSVRITDEHVKKFDTKESCEKAEKASNKKKESSWPSLSTSLTGWGSSWGKYITDTAKQTTEGVSDLIQYTTDAVSSTLINLTTPETTKKIVENQKPDGSIKLDKTVSDQINISSDKIQSSIQTYGVSDKISPEEHQHKDQSEKAKKYLIEELKDEKLVEELLITSEKIIVDQSVKKGKENAALDVESNESLVSSIKTYFINKGTKAPEDKKLLDTAITLSFLRKTLSTDTSPELKEKVAKAEKYLKTELGSEEKIKELLEKTDTVVVDHAAKKVIKEKADQSVIQEIQETVTEEEITKVIEIQNKEGSYEKYLTKLPKNLDSEKVAEASKKEALKEIQITPEITKIIVSTQKTDGSFEVSKEITDKLNSTSPESLVTSVITYTKNDKLKNIQPSVWQTVISMQYLKNTASQYENDWKDSSISAWRR
ncbi:unnamed protein product [Rhizophagus irregularis]|nr:unnamed protein product [Rhizophagus irregularis]